MNRKIILSLGVVVFVTALSMTATGAFFSDTETSTGNTFTAGAIDLQVDNTCYYNKIADGQPNCPTVSDNPDTPLVNEALLTTWTMTDLGPTHRFFNFSDVKPGDFGEDTISLHVFTNDAWGRFVISNVQDLDNTCTEPESDPLVPDPQCGETVPGAGELASSITFSAWIDDGAIAGFQGIANDVGEGDNIKQPNEQIIIAPGTVDLVGETHNIWAGLSAYRTFLGATCAVTDADGDGHTTNVTDACRGIAVDGRLDGTVDYYFGLGWSVPTTVGNEAQTDSLNADLSFQIVQHRNNPGHSF